MSKYGIGVGEDFPVNDPPQPSSPPPGGPDGARGDWRGPPGHWHRHGALHTIAHILIVLFALSVIAFLIASTVHMFYPGAGYGPSGYGYGYWRPHFFFFPFWPLFLILIFALAFRRRRWGCYGYGYGPPYRRGYWQWHDEPPPRQPGREA